MVEHIKAYAKLNLYLGMHGKRADGFHELSTLLHEIDLADELEIAESEQRGESEEDRLEVDDPEIPADKNNLVMKTLSLLRGEGFKFPALSIKLSKRIPAGGGLGGGSADAMAVLKYVATKYLNCPAPEIASNFAELSARIGSDTTFFLTGGSAWCTGRGELVQPQKHHHFYFNLILPPFACATPVVYAAVQADVDRVEKSVSSNWLKNWNKGEAVCPQNSLETACGSAYPSVAHLLGDCRNKGLDIFLSGSGSTSFTVSCDLQQRDGQHEMLKANLNEESKILKAESRVFC